MIPIQEDTILVQNLPNIPKNETEGFLSSFAGFRALKMMDPSCRSNGAAFILFESPLTAADCIRLVHQSVFFGSRLTATFALLSDVEHYIWARPRTQPDPERLGIVTDELYLIAPEMNFEQPLSSNLAAQFKPPTMESAQQIVKLMREDVHIYYRLCFCLKLMGINDLCKNQSIVQNCNYEICPLCDRLASSSSESEMDDDDDNKGKNIMDAEKVKTRKWKLKSTIRSTKSMARFLKPQKLTAESKNVFPAYLKVKPREIIISPQVAITMQPPQVGGQSIDEERFGTFTTDKTPIIVKAIPCKLPISAEEVVPIGLYAIVQESDRSNWKLFKNYCCGEPGCRLYIKNVAKDVTENELYAIFGNFIDFDNPGDVDAFDVRLMQKGRMRGQAFVAFTSTEKAQIALKTTNGLILREDKPIVVTFARSCQAAVDQNCSI